MKAYDDEGVWFLHLSGGRIGEQFVEPDDVGPLPAPPSLVLRWVQPEGDVRGAGATTFSRLDAGGVVFTVRHYRWRSADHSEQFEFEVVMRALQGDGFVNPEPPDSAVPERWSPDGWLML